MIEERVTELESKFAFQENMIQELNDVLIAQQKNIDNLFLKLQTVIAQLDAVMPADIAPESEETPPPHY